MKFIQRVLIVAASLLFLSGEGIPAARSCVTYIKNRQNKRVQITIEVANNHQLRRKGLMFRKHLPKNSGMIFVFSQEQNLSFWMKNTSIPLCIAYISSSGKINEIHDMKPLDISQTYPSRYPAKYALEMNRGWFKNNNITRGCRIDINGCIGK